MKLDPVVTAVGEHVPLALLRPLLSRALAGMEVSLCLHRVSETRRTTDWQPYLNIPPSQLDALLALLVSARPATDHWITVTFDDGYADAADYLESRAARFPSVQWRFFLCPQKTERAAGFRWDEVEVGQRSQAGFHDAMDVATENARPQLTAVGQDALFQLASLEQVLRLAQLPNVMLGNHTNCHFRSVLLSPEQAQQEFQASRADFERLFGPQREFAFPFGTPNHDFKPEHVAQLRALGPSLIWSTERRPFRPSERSENAVLPRFPVNGTWTHRQLALWIASRALIFRARGTPHHF